MTESTQTTPWIDLSPSIPLHLPVPASIQAILVPTTNLSSPAKSDDTRSGSCTPIISLISLNIAIDPCLGADALDCVLHHISHRICPLSETRRLDLVIKTAKSPVTTLNLPSSSFGEQEVIPELEHLILRNYSFLPQSLCLPLSIPLTRIKNLELFGCSNTGYLFNNMLSVYLDMRLESLRIVDSTSQQGSGYVGEDKLDHFLLTYKGLKLLDIRGLGQPSPSLTAVLA